VRTVTADLTVYVDGCSAALVGRRVGRVHPKSGHARVAAVHRRWSGSAHGHDGPNLSDALVRAAAAALSARCPDAKLRCGLRVAPLPRSSLVTVPDSVTHCDATRGGATELAPLRRRHRTVTGRIRCRSAYRQWRAVNGADLVGSPWQPALVRWGHVRSVPAVGGDVHACCAVVYAVHARHAEIARTLKLSRADAIFAQLALEQVGS
jgi:hypothetical protein